MSSFDDDGYQDGVASLVSFRPPPARSQARGCGGGPGWLPPALSCGTAGCEVGEFEVEAAAPRRSAIAPPPEFSLGDHDIAPEIEGGPSIFSTEPQSTAGEVFRRGPAWMLTEAPGSCESVEAGEIRLHANTLQFRRDGGARGELQPLNVLLTPFAFVRPVAVQSPALREAAGPVVSAKIFGITTYLDGGARFFAVGDRDESKATELCMEWVVDVARSIRWVTESLFVRGSCFQVLPALQARSSVRPDRLMGGCLLYSAGASESVRVLYAELIPPVGGRAQLVFFEDPSCETGPWREQRLDARTPCYEKVGHECSCFCVGPLHLSARTVFERQLWLRTISNLKVKMQSRGEDPTSAELLLWQQSISDHIGHNTAKLRNSLDEHCRAEDCAAAEMLRGVPLLRRGSPESARDGGGLLDEEGRESTSGSSSKGGSSQGGGLLGGAFGSALAVPWDGRV